MARILILSLALALMGCATNYRDTSPYYYSGRPKPSVALLPVIDSTSGQEYAWDLSSELTVEMKKRLENSHKLYLVSHCMGNSTLAESINVASPTGLPNNMVESLKPAQFVIATELIEQKVTPYGPAASTPDVNYIAESGAMLTLSMRIRVIDLRNEKPEVILQEIVDTDHNIMKPYLYVDYSKYPYGSDFYDRTPLGIAHAKLIKEVVSHIECYVGSR